MGFIAACPGPARGCVALVVAGCAAHAAGAATPIDGPTVITRSGSYVVTQEIAGSATPVIRIAANDVTLDLGGHSVRCVGCPAPASGVVQAQRAKRVEVRNGRLAGPGACVALEQVESFSISDIHCMPGFGSTGFHIADSSRGVVRGSKTMFGWWGVVAVRSRYLVFSRNAHLEPFNAGILAECEGCEIVENTVMRSIGWGIQVTGSRNRVTGNSLLGFDVDGILARGRFNRVEDNRLRPLSKSRWSLYLIGGANRQTRNTIIRPPARDTRHPCHGFSTNNEICIEPGDIALFLQDP